MDDILFSIIIYAAHTNRLYFRDCIESVVAQSYGTFELIIVDENPGTDLGRIVSEFFPEDPRIIYRHLRRPGGKARALNYAIDTAKGQYYVFHGQHDRLSGNALALIAAEAAKKPAFSILYTDCDELDGADRVHPHFKSALNIELLRQTNYIGTSFVVSAAAYVGLGRFRTELSFYPEWEFLLRASDRRMKFVHLGGLLFHIRPDDGLTPEEPAELAAWKKAKKEEDKKAAREAGAIVTASLKRLGLTAEVRKGSRPGLVKVIYDGSGWDIHRNDYLLLKDPGVRALSHHALERLYGVFRQPDVAIVGCRFIGSGLTVENAGYIFDTNGLSYPACHGQSILAPGYEGRISLRQDVSAVDLSYCLIDKKFYERCGGFDGDLTGRDIMTDICLKAAAAGRRVVYEPAVTAYRARNGAPSSEASNAALLDKWKKRIRKGDPYYNPNLPMGLSNYTLSE